MITFALIGRAAQAIGELWSPRTDGGVLAQVIITILLVVGLAIVARKEPAIVQLIVGIGLVVLAWYGVRALH